MVSFSCEACNETMIKKKVAPHINRCSAPVTCIDCSKTFPGQTFKSHNQCMTEDQKYQGKLYKSKQPDVPPAKKQGSPNEQESKHAPSAVAPPSPIQLKKQSSLKKVIKQLRKEHKLDKKQILEKLTVDPTGKLLLMP